MGMCTECHKTEFVGTQCNCSTDGDVRHVKHEWTTTKIEDHDGRQMDPRQTSKFMHGVESDKKGLVTSAVQENECCLDREFDPRKDLKIADPELGGFQLSHVDMFSSEIASCSESLEQLMTELFFHRGDMHVEV